MNQQLTRLLPFGYSLETDFLFFSQPQLSIFFAIGMLIRNSGASRRNSGRKTANSSELRQSAGAVPKVEEVYDTMRLVARVENQKWRHRHLTNPAPLVVKRKSLRQGRQTRACVRACYLNESPRLNHASVTQRLPCRGHEWRKFAPSMIRWAILIPAPATFDLSLTSATPLTGPVLIPMRSLKGGLSFN